MVGQVYECIMLQSCTPILHQQCHQQQSKSLLNGQQHQYHLVNCWLKINNLIRVCPRSAGTNHSADFEKFYQMVDIANATLSMTLIFVVKVVLERLCWQNISQNFYIAYVCIQAIIQEINLPPRSMILLVSITLFEPYTSNRRKAD